MEVNNHMKKLKLLFDRLLEPNYELNSYYADNLLKCLEHNKDANKILDTPFFSDLILYAMGNLDNVTESVKVFIMNLSIIIMRNELQFSKLMHVQAFHTMMSRFSIMRPDISSTGLKLAYIQQAVAQISHSSGLYWILEQKIWLYIFNSCYQTQPIPVLRAAYNFLGKFVWRLNELEDETNSLVVLEPIVRPVIASDYHKIQMMTSDIEKQLIAQLKPSVGTLLAILDDTDSIAKPSKTIQLLAKYFILEPYLYVLLELIKEEEFACSMSELTFRLSFVIARENPKPPNQTENEFVSEGIAYYNIVHCLVQKRMTSVILDFAIKCNVYWWKMCLPSTFQRYGRKFEIQNQLIALLVVPFLVYISDKYSQDESYREGVDIYTMKLTSIISEQIVKASYSFRSLVEESDKRAVAIQAARQLFKLKGHINSQQAGTIYQALFYVLKQHVVTDESGSLVTTETKLKCADDFRLISLILDAVKMLLKEHNINWYESCEIVCLYNLIMNLLKPKLMPNKLVVQALDLINLAVKKFLPPDLSLLMESRSGSALMEIAEVISAGMMDEEWEVRDSAMHLLLTCTDISFVKYIPFQKLISANGLITTAAHRALSDPSHYVQATALRCLAATARIDKIWRELLYAHPHINVQLVYILKKNPEGLVRKEAANVLTEVYVNQKISTACKNNLYSVMGSAALDDLYWEVQLSALHFWKKTIQNMLAYCGMIDGKFPSVTFSKEKRKIVILDQWEIRKQLAKILNELACNGCLSVLNKCMNEDYNIEVMEQAYCVSKDFIEILTRYNVTGVPDSDKIHMPLSNLNNLGMDMDSAMDLSMSQNVEPLIDRDKVIDSILNTNQSELIVKMYENYIDIKAESVDDDLFLNSVISPRMFLDPNEFLTNFRETDYLSMINEKKIWNSDEKSLNSLLDEILSLSGKNYIQLGCS